MKIKLYYLIKLSFFWIIGASLLLLSAVYENGGSELSCALIVRMSDVPEMTETLIASVAVTLMGACCAVYLELIGYIK